jgi:hypothetical protein
VQNTRADGEGKKNPLPVRHRHSGKIFSIFLERLRSVLIWCGQVFPKPLAFFGENRRELCPLSQILPQNPLVDMELRLLRTDSVVFESRNLLIDMYIYNCPTT